MTKLKTSWIFYPTFSTRLIFFLIFLGLFFSCSSLTKASRNDLSSSDANPYPSKPTIPFSPENPILDDPVLEDPVFLTHQCRYGASFGNCLKNQPLFCNNGQLENKASLCGCPKGFQVQGETCTPISSVPKVFFISPNGSDGSDGSLQHPWATITHAWEQTNQGDTVYLRGGTYNQSGDNWLVGGSETSNEFWELRAYPGETPVFINGRIIIDSPFIRILGLHITENAYLQTDDSGGVHQHIEVIENDFSNPWPMEFMARQSLVEGNFIHLINAPSHGLYIMHGDENIVRNNYVSGAFKYGIQIYDENKYAGSPNITNLLVEGNIIVGSQTRSGIIVSAGESNEKAIEINGVILRNNISLNNFGSGITLQLYGKIRNIQILHNVFYNNDAGISIGAQDVDQITIKNNIFSSNPSPFNITSQIPSGGLTISHNLFWEPASIGSGINDSNAIFEDPLFVDPSEENFSIQSSSSPVCGKADDGGDIGAFACP